MTDDYEVVTRLTLDEAKELVSAAEELLEATRGEIHSEYEWDVDFNKVRINSQQARIRFKRALEAFNRETREVTVEEIVMLMNQETASAKKE